MREFIGIGAGRRRDETLVGIFDKTASRRFYSTALSASGVSAEQLKELALAAIRHRSAGQNRIWRNRRIRLASSLHPLHTPHVTLCSKWSLVTALFFEKLQHIFKEDEALVFKEHEMSRVFDQDIVLDWRVYEFTH